MVSLRRHSSSLDSVVSNSAVACTGAAVRRTEPRDQPTRASFVESLACVLSFAFSLMRHANTSERRTHRTQVGQGLRSARPPVFGPRQDAVDLRSDPSRVQIGGFIISLLRGRKKAKARSERASQTKKRERASSMVSGGVGTPRREQSGNSRRCWSSGLTSKNKNN